MAQEWPTKCCFYFTEIAPNQSFMPKKNNFLSQAFMMDRVLESQASQIMTALVQKFDINASCFASWQHSYETKRGTHDILTSAFTTVEKSIRFPNSVPVAQLAAHNANIAKSLRDSDLIYESIKSLT